MKRLSVVHLLSLLGCVFFFLLSGCGEVELSPGETPAERFGTITGRICAPTGDAWLENAYIYVNLVDEAGLISGIRETYSDPDGYFVLSKLPEGAAVTLYIQKGTWQTSQEAYVEEGKVTALPTPPCLDPLSVNAAVVTGEFDSFSRILEELGIANHIVIDGNQPSAVASFFGNLELLLGFDVICLNGGMLEGAVLSDEVAVANLEAYVKAGGTLFATDWAYDWVEHAFPGAIDFLGDDSQTDAAQLGVAALIEGRVVDQSLAAYVGSSTVGLRYDLAYWPVIEGAVPQVVVHVSGDAQYYDEGELVQSLSAAPLLVSFSSGYGTVIYSTFRGEANLSDDTTRILQYMLYKI